MHDVRHELLHDDLVAAHERLADAGRGTGDLLFALEDGLLLHYLGDYGLSNDRFAFAEGRIDYLYTKSISRALLSMVTSDLALKWEPRGVEPFLVNHYRALNYLRLGEPEEARVEWRKLASELQFSRGEEGGDVPYRDPPFFNYLVGLGLEADDPSAAYVSLRQAEAGYRRSGDRPPPELIEDLTRLAARLGFADHLERYASRYGVDPCACGGGDGTDESPTGEVVLLVEEGLVAPIEEVRAYIPIIEKREKWARSEEDERRLDLAHVLAEEYRAGRYREVGPDDEGEHGIAYVMPIALPRFGRGVPAFGHLAVAIGPDSASARPALDISALQRAAFRDRLTRIYVKTIARALVKYAAAVKFTEEAEEKHGETARDVMQILSNAINVVTERADTRAWLGLPHRIWLARLQLPPGSYKVGALVGDPEARPVGTVEVRAGERTFVSHRVF